MTLTPDDLRRKILRSPTDRERHIFILPKDTLLRESEISESDVTFMIQEDVLWFQVSVNDSFVV